MIDPHAETRFHVYILHSKATQMIKVGKTRGFARHAALARMGYAGANDWSLCATFVVDSNHEALALESMVIAHLSNRQYKVPRLQWVNLINQRPSFADECFSCTVDIAVEAANAMLEILVQGIR